MDATPLTRCVPQPVVVKIGGSLLRQAPPRPLLAHLAALAPVVLVPGGGALADAVRDAQPHLGLSDKAAHAMALGFREKWLDPETLETEDSTSCGTSPASGSAENGR